jgi:hypothetical protein
MTIFHEAGPFAIVPLWVHRSLVETKNVQALGLYVALHEWASTSDRTAHPSRKKLAEKCGVSDKTIDTWVKALVAIGALRVKARYSEEGDRTSNDYTLLISPPREVDVGTGGEVDFAGTKPTSNETQLNDSSSSPPAVACLHPDEFDRFWKTYGNLAGTGKKKAKECWNVAMKRGDPPAEIIAGLEAWVTYWRAPGAAKAMFAQGFLNQQKWTTPPPPLVGERKEAPGMGALRRRMKNQDVLDVHSSETQTQMKEIG